MIRRLGVVFSAVVLSLLITETRSSGEVREYLLGDVDGLHYDGPGSADHVYVDPGYWAQMEGTIHPPVAFDVMDENRHRPGTFLFPLGPGEVVVAASCTVAIKGIDQLVSTDGIGFQASDGFSVGGYYDEWGWDPVPEDRVVLRTVDLANAMGQDMLPHIQDGLLNFSTNDDTAVDYATLRIEVVPEPIPGAMLLAGAMAIAAFTGRR